MKTTLNNSIQAIQDNSGEITIIGAATAIISAVTYFVLTYGIHETFVY